MIFSSKILYEIGTSGHGAIGITYEPMHNVQVQIQNSALSSLSNQSIMRLMISIFLPINDDPEPQDIVRMTNNKFLP